MHPESPDNLVPRYRDNNVGRGFALMAAVLLAHAPAAVHAQLLPSGPALEYPGAHPRPFAIFGRVLSVSPGESEYGAEREADAAVGGVIPIVRVSGGRAPIALGLALGVVARFSLDDPRTALISTDWTVGLHAATRVDRWRLALHLYHESSHLGDEYAERFDATRLDWTREVAALWASRGIGAFTAHAQLSYTLVDELALPRGAAGLGLDYRGPAAPVLGARLRPVVGVYVESVAFADWSVTTTGRAGVEFDAGGRSAGVAIVALDGRSPQRQFFGRRSGYLGIELRFDL